MSASNDIIIAVTGASGSIYAQRFLECALQHFDNIKLVFSETGIKVSRFELSQEQANDGLSLLPFLSANHPHASRVSVFKNKDLFACLASGTSAPKKMVIVPCSMGTLGRIAAGLGSNLIERAADVVLKEKGQLVISPRETPFNTLHLENMLRLDRAGAHIVPPIPGFYQHPKSSSDMIDFVVGKLLEAFRVDHGLYPAWQSGDD